ncbi:hypothetical protein [Chrysiogenes arsenatis]|uniref:hypothetical protein n=1 Tax=Chrysiogenes arsenatis TaxID=309797 RepID=UPI0004105636|nr:hypothetical protein [Chrysiogenes arsenatis]
MDSKDTRGSLDKIYESIRKGVVKSKDEVVKLTKIGKLKLEIVNLERKKSAKLQELGELTYQLLKTGNLQFNEEFLGLIEQVEKIEAEITVHDSLLEEIHLSSEMADLTPDEQTKPEEKPEEVDENSKKPIDAPEDYIADDIGIATPRTEGVETESHHTESEKKASEK